MYSFVIRSLFASDYKYNFMRLQRYNTNRTCLNKSYFRICLRFRLFVWKIMIKVPRPRGWCGRAKPHNIIIYEWLIIIYEEIFRFVRYTICTGQANFFILWKVQIWLFRLYKYVMTIDSVKEWRINPVKSISKISSIHTFIYFYQKKPFTLGYCIFFFFLQSYTWLKYLLYRFCGSDDCH